MATIALLGSGEFQPWCRPVEEWCLERSTGSSDRVLVVPTASAPEGEETFRRWADMGMAHYTGIGAAPQVVEMRERADASRPEIVDAVADARMVFFSGGNPGYLVETIQGTPFFDALAAAIASGVAIGGCSAGAVALGTVAPFVHNMEFQRWLPGLRMLSRGYLIPHFDMLDTFQDGLRAFVLAGRPPGDVGVGIDEDTAIYGDGEAWTVCGKGSAWVIEDDVEPSPHPDGATLSLPLGLTLPA